MSEDYYSLIMENRQDIAASNEKIREIAEWMEKQNRSTRLQKKPKPTPEEAREVLKEAGVRFIDE